MCIRDRTARALGMATEASMRFSKGVDCANVEFAMKRACRLVEELAAGENVSGVIDVLSEDVYKRQHHRFKRGYKNVINEAKRLNEAGTDCQLAMETSGHGALKENYFLDDGAYLMVKLKMCIRDRLFALSCSPTFRKRASARSSAAFFSIPRTERGAIVMLSSTDRWGNRLKF